MYENYIQPDTGVLPVHSFKKFFAITGILATLLTTTGIQQTAHALTTSQTTQKFNYSAEVIEAVENSSIIEDYLNAQGANTPENKAEIASYIDDPSIIYALDELYSQGDITPPGVNKKPTLAEFQINSATPQAGLRCPAAWAALYAWAAANAGTCAAFGLGGPAAAFACWLVMTGISGLVDFNDACK